MPTDSHWRVRSRRRPDGNPFFVGEILRNLSESGLIVFDETARRWRSTAAPGCALPESVREVVERRVGVLGERCAGGADVAAVIGRSFDLELLAQLVEIERERLLDQLERRWQASLLAESTDRVGRFSFAHALINHTLYEGLGATRRARLHQRVAEALEDLYGTDSERASGGACPALAAGDRVGRQAKAAGYSLRAGQRALDSLAPSEAAKLFADALELLGPGDALDRCEALIGLGDAQRQTGDPGVPRDAARGVRHRLATWRTPTSPPGRRCEQPRFREQIRCRRRGAGRGDRTGARAG